MNKKNTDNIKKSLRINTKLVVNHVTNRESEFYDSRIEDIDDERIVISLPTRKSTPMPTTRGSLLRVSALLPDGRVSFESKIQGIITKPIYMLIINMPEILSHEQVRHFYRVPVHLRVKVFLLDNLNKTDGDDTITYEEGSVDDISGGGCRLTTQAELHVGNNITLDFTGSAIDNVGCIQCNVIRVSPKSGNKIIASLKFYELDDLIEDRIVRYVFRRQLELKKLLADK